jgi:hypothetical protein
MATKNKKGFSFDDLKFEEHPLVKGLKKGHNPYNYKGVHAYHSFDNGINVSIVQISMMMPDKKTGRKKRLFLAYQSSLREYEMMITASNEESAEKFNEVVEKQKIPYMRLDNPLGFLLKSEITKILQTIEKI